MYSFSGRLNFFLYNALFLLSVAGFFNHVSVRYGHLLGLREKPVGLDAADVSFQVKDIDIFLIDKYLNEEAISFKFDMHADLTQLYTWNTNLVFASIVCEFATKTSAHNSVTVWD